MKKLILIISLAVVAITLNSCLMGYVASEPAYVEYSRPARPNTTSIWIDGDWNWSIQTHTYVQQHGYWDSPRPNQSYRAGYWQQTPKGKSWSKGRWEKDNKARNDNKGRNNNRRDN